MIDNVRDGLCAAYKHLLLLCWYGSWREDVPLGTGVVDTKIYTVFTAVVMVHNRKLSGLATRLVLKGNAAFICRFSEIQSWLLPRSPREFSLRRGDETAKVIRQKNCIHLYKFIIKT